MSERMIGTISNYYGSLSVKEDDGKYFWGIDDFNGIRWEEIPKSLYDELMKFQDQKQKRE